MINGHDEYMMESLKNIQSVDSTDMSGILFLSVIR